MTVKRQPWTRLEEQRACLLRRAGHTHKEIARSLGTGRRWQAVKTRLHKLGCHAPITRREDIEADIRRLAALGLWPAEIARRLGLAFDGSLHRWLRDLDVRGLCGNGHSQPRSAHHAENVARAQVDMHRKEAAALGWPEANTALEARILQALHDAREPLTRRQLAALIGRDSRREPLVEPLHRMAALRLVEMRRGWGAATYSLPAWLLEGRAES